MTQKAIWAKCPQCGQCWAAVQYPAEMALIGEQLQDVRCPAGCAAAPVLAKQDDGILLEASTPQELEELFQTVRQRIEPRLVDLLTGLRRHQVQEAVALLLDYIDAARVAPPAEPGSPA